MPHVKFSLSQAAAYLHLSEEQILRLAKQGEFDVHYNGDTPTFWKRELHDWASQKLLGEENQNNDYQSKGDDILEEGVDRNTPFLSKFLIPESINMNLQAKTKSSLLKELVALAALSYHITDEVEYQRLLEEREAMCATGIINGVALPHTRVHADYLVMDSFLTIARVRNGIHFGSIDGAKSDLFIMPCSDSDQTHLYMLARLAYLFQKTDLADQLRQLDDPEDVISVFKQKEVELVQAGNSSR